MSRYNQLIKIFEKCLLESSKCIDTKHAVEECYGEDLSMFATTSTSNSTTSSATSKKSNDDGGIETLMLENLVRDVLEKINESFVQNELSQILSKEKVELKLDILDKVIRDYLADQQQREELEKNDIQSAQDAVAKTQFLPQGINLNDILTYQSYQMKIKMRDELAGKVQELVAVRDKLLNEIEQSQTIVKDIVKGIDQSIVEPLNKNADICSFNGIS